MKSDPKPIDPARFDLALAILEDLVPFAGSSLATAVRQFLSRRADKARSILTSELARQGLDLEVVAQRDELFGPLIRYLRAVRDGRGEANLRLMAQLLVAQAVAPRFDDASAEFFLDILAELSEAEIRLIATLHRYCKARRPDEKQVPFARMLDEVVPGVFPSNDHAHAVAARAAQSGLLAFEMDAWGTFYKTSALMADLEELPLFQAVMGDPYATLSEDR